MTTELTATTPKDFPLSVKHRVSQWSCDKISHKTDEVAQEIAVALVYNGISHVVMMASPCDLEDLAVGFTLSEAIINQPGDIQEINITEQQLGIEIDIKISARSMWGLKQQRRNMTGRTGCGLCGAESLQQAVRTLSPASSELPQALKICKHTHAAIQQAVATLQQHQPLQQQTGAVHGAAWCDSDGNILVAREDIGRHNALDKLIGALYHQTLNHKVSNDKISDGFAIISSRASYEMVTKAHQAGIKMLVAVSAPTSMAINLAQQAGITLVGFARNGRHTFYT